MQHCWVSMKQKVRIKVTLLWLSRNRLKYSYHNKHELPNAVLALACLPIFILFPYSNKYSDIMQSHHKTPTRRLNADVSKINEKIGNLYAQAHAWPWQRRKRLRHVSLTERETPLAPRRPGPVWWTDLGPAHTSMHPLLHHCPTAACPYHSLSAYGPIQLVVWAAVFYLYFASINNAAGDTNTYDDSGGE